MVEQIVDTGRQRQPRLRPAAAHIKHRITGGRALAGIRVDARLVVGKTHRRLVTPCIALPALRQLAIDR